MVSLAETISRLSARRQRASAADPSANRLTRLGEVGTNPGNLAGWYYLPADAGPELPLVVVLHGCTQTAAGYDHGSGWSQVADEAGFALLFPEQRRANNANLCFNWFEPAHNRRGAGEPLSIRQMIDAMIARHGVDPQHVYVTGLSAGGAMTSVMLATYPGLFAGGAIIAGLPYGIANSLPEALGGMRRRTGVNAPMLAKAVRDASDHRGPWPRLSVWHGSADTIVDVSNADAIVAQWLAVQGITDKPIEDVVDRHVHRVWHDASGKAVIEEFRVQGLGHGTPLATQGPERCGAVGPHMLEAGIASTRHIARFWGIADRAGTQEGYPDRASDPAGFADMASGGHPEWFEPAALSYLPSPARPDVAATIEHALRSAGLLR